MKSSEIFLNGISQIITVEIYEETPEGISKGIANKTFEEIAKKNPKNSE